MNKTVLGVALAFVSVLLIGGVIFAANRSMDTSSEKKSSDANHSSSDPMHDNSDGHHDNDNSDDMMMAANEVTIKDFDFQPAKIQIKVGTTVTWTNQDSARHDVAPVVDSPDFVGSELLAKGESYSFTFTKAGTYDYICSPHPYMEGTVEVIE